VTRLAAPVRIGIFLVRLAAGHGRAEARTCGSMRGTRTRPRRSEPQRYFTVSLLWPNSTRRAASSSTTGFTLIDFARS
jgi:hypothetical protein